MIREIDARELKEKMDKGETYQFNEWNEARIEGATLLPLSEFEAKYQSVLTDKNKPIIIHCRSGKRSLNACMFLLSQGYSDLTNVEGGILGWINEGYPVTQG